MRYSRILGLAVIAALLALALAGIGTASAAETVLCKATEESCGGADMYGTGTEIHAVSTTEWRLQAGFGTVKCKKSTLRGKTETTTTPESNLEALSLEECNCPVTVVKPGKVQLHWDAEHNASLTAKEFEFRVGNGETTCFFINNFECVYSGEIVTGLTVKGGNPATLAATEATVPRTGGSSGELICGKNGKLSASYEITSPKPLFVAKTAQ